MDFSHIQKYLFQFSSMCAIFTIAGAFTAHANTLYVIHDTSNKITAYSINASTGILTKADIGDVETGVQPRTILSVSGKYLYVGNLASYSLSQYAIQPDQKLVLLSNIFNPSPWALTTDPRVEHLYVSNYYYSNLSQYLIDLDGASLVPLDPLTVATGTSPTDVGFDPLETPYGYVVNSANNTVGLYSFNASTGQLTYTGNSVSTGSTPVGIWFDNAHHVYVINQTSNTVSMYYADPSNGQLEPLEPSTIQTGVGPSDFAMDMTKKYAYITSLDQNRIYMYKIKSDGALEALSPAYVATGVMPQSIALDDNNHLYVINAAENTISMYSIDPTTGLLIQLSPAKVATEAGAYTATVVEV